MVTTTLRYASSAVEADDSAGPALQGLDELYRHVLVPPTVLAWGRSRAGVEDQEEEGAVEP